jgi:hypothetical protein
MVNFFRLVVVFSRKVIAYLNEAPPRHSTLGWAPELTS